MSKQEFLSRLRGDLSGLPQDDIEERIAFYSEMIDDRMEDGLSEEEAVSAVRSIDDGAPEADIPPSKDTEEGLKQKRRLSAGEIVLLSLGSPVWLPLCAAVFAAALSLYAVLWSLIVSLWAVFASFAAGSVCGALYCIIFAAGGKALSGIAVLAAGIVCAGLSVFAFYGCRAATKGLLTLTKKTAVRIKNCFTRKERA